MEDKFWITLNPDSECKVEVYFSENVLREIIRSGLEWLEKVAMKRGG